MTLLEHRNTKNFPGGSIVPCIASILLVVVISIHIRMPKFMFMIIFRGIPTQIIILTSKKISNRGLDVIGRRRQCFQLQLQD